MRTAALVLSTVGGLVLVVAGGAVIILAIRREFRIWRVQRDMDRVLERRYRR